MDCDDTERGELSPRSMQKRLQGFLQLRQIARHGTCLNTKRIPEVRSGNVACLSKVTVFVESERVGITHEEQCEH